MKKIISVLLICLVLVLGQVNLAMADEIQPRYNSITRVISGIYPGNQSITYDLYVYVPNTEALDYAFVDLELRNTAGVVVGRYTGKRMSHEGLVHYYSGSTDISANGTYFYTYEIRCYKDGVIVDNPTGTSRTLVYTP